MTDDTELILMKINEINLKLDLSENINEIKAKNKQLEYRIELLEDKVEKWESYIIKSSSSERQNIHTPGENELNKKVKRIAAGLDPD